MVRLTDAQERDKSENWIASVRSRLALRRAEKPATKAGQILAVWPEIEAALAGGQSMKSIRRWLEEDAGITLGLTSLTSYISRLRRRQTANWRIGASSEDSVRAQTKVEPVLAPRLARATFTTRPNAKSAPEQPEDPLAQAMRALSKPRFDIRQSHGDGDPQGKNLI
jgi:hypothetical protein